MFSITEISVDVVSNPQNAAQSFTTKPDPITSLPLFIVPTHNGTYKRFNSSSSSFKLHIHNYILEF